MAKYVDGDRDAFDALFRSLAPRVHGFFLRRFGDPAMADDLLQTTFLKVHRARRDYRVGSPVRPWVFTIAARVSLDEFRRRGRRPEDADEARLEKATAAVAVHRAEEPDLVERADVASQVRAAIDQLPETQRVVVLLHRYEGFTFDEIGSMIGATEGAVKLRAFRAYEHLRRNLAPLMRELSGANEQAASSADLAAAASTASAGPAAKRIREGNTAE